MRYVFTVYVFLKYQYTMCKSQINLCKKHNKKIQQKHGHQLEMGARPKQMISEKCMKSRLTKAPKTSI